MGTAYYVTPLFCFGIDLHVRRRVKKAPITSCVRPGHIGINNIWGGFLILQRLAEKQTRESTGADGEGAGSI
jgi:hypothetical protein